LTEPLIEDVSHAPLFFVEELSGTTVSLGPQDARHLAMVRRARPGDVVRVADGRGTLATVRITSVSDNQVVADVERSEFVEPSPLDVCVYQALPKGTKADLVIQKLTEIGVQRVVMFAAQRSVPEWDQRRSASAVDRWSAIAMEAAKQSNRIRLPAIEGLWDARKVAEDLSSSEVKLAAHAASGRRLRDALGSKMPPSVALIIGPEGGLTDDELGLFSESGAMSVSFGSPILRTETAALAGATMILYHYERLG